MKVIACSLVIGRKSALNERLFSQALYRAMFQHFGLPKTHLHALSIGIFRIFSPLSARPWLGLTKSSTVLDSKTRGAVLAHVKDSLDPSKC